ncbi:hypothetical protein C8R46DRAFT_1037609 [Mycena filopes]|nr:hypothetical protein C8R46DRAFT_1037609 [Mycena filopes]
MIFPRFTAALKSNRTWLRKFSEYICSSINVLRLTDSLGRCWYINQLTLGTSRGSEQTLQRSAVKRNSTKGAAIKGFGGEIFGISDKNMRRSKFMKRTFKVVFKHYKNPLRDSGNEHPARCLIKVLIYNLRVCVFPSAMHDLLLSDPRRPSKNLSPSGENAKAKVKRATYACLRRDSNPHLPENIWGHPRIHPGRSSTDRQRHVQAFHGCLGTYWLWFKKPSQENQKCQWIGGEPKSSVVQTLKHDALQQLHAKESGPLHDYGSMAGSSPTQICSKRQARVLTVYYTVSQLNTTSCIIFARDKERPASILSLFNRGCFSPPGLVWAVGVQAGAVCVVALAKLTLGATKFCVLFGFGSAPGISKAWLPHTACSP